MSDETTDLSLVATDDLIEELMKRCDTIVIAREYRAKEGDDRKTMIEYSGSLNAAHGLASRAVRLTRRWCDEDDD